MSRTAAILGLAACLLAPVALHAAPVKTIDGVVLITQADALAGGVTPGDAPGYPILISAAGSYRLGGPLTVTGATTGIEVRAPLVTLDFNGFALLGNGTGGPGVDGYGRALTVKNGTVRNFTGFGIISSETEMVVANMRVDTVAGTGIVGYLTSGGLTDGRSIFRDNIVTNVALLGGQGGFGISCGGQSCMILRNVVSDIASAGIFIDDTTKSSLVLDNVVSRAQGNGIGLESTGSGVGRNTLVGNTNSGNPAPFGGVAPGSLGPNVCSPLPNPVPAGC